LQNCNNLAVFINCTLQLRFFIPSLCNNKKIGCFRAILLHFAFVISLLYATILNRPFCAILLHLAFCISILYATILNRPFLCISFFASCILYIPSLCNNLKSAFFAILLHFFLMQQSKIGRFFSISLHLTFCIFLPHPRI
jgi:hypothetical protein